MTATAERPGIETLKRRIAEMIPGPVSIMEVCGTHTAAIARSGLRQVLPGDLRLISGPGCPVCVTAAGDIDRVLDLGRKEGVRLLTFGDMLRVPGTSGSMEDLRAQRGNIRVVYSPMDALALAEKEPSAECVFVGVGFETTAPAVAAAVLAARKRGLTNFSVAPLFKLVPPALRAILGVRERRIDGFLLPGHVSTVLGLRPYAFIAEEFGVPGVISGFEPEDILESLAALLEMIRSRAPDIKNQYARSVRTEGNPSAMDLLFKVFLPRDARWRALGYMPLSGLGFRPEFSAFDAFERFSVPERPSREPKGCRCGDILLGLCGPADCPLFRRSCTPSRAVGPCMVSSEGACSAAYHFGEEVLP